MIGGQEDAPGVLDQQEQLEPNRPLQRVDKIPVAISERHQTAATVAFDIHADPLVRHRLAAIAELCLGIAGLRHGVAEHDLSDIEADIAFRVHGGSEPSRGG